MSKEQFFKDLENLPDIEYVSGRYRPQYDCPNGCPAYYLATINGKFVESSLGMFDELARRYGVTAGDVQDFAYEYDQIAKSRKGKLKHIRSAIRNLRSDYARSIQS